MVDAGIVETQCPPDRPQHVGRRVDPPTLLEPRVPRHGDAGEHRHLLAAQSRRAPCPTGGQSDLRRRQRLPPGAEELGEGGAVIGRWWGGGHGTSDSSAPPRRVGARYRAHPPARGALTLPLGERSRWASCCRSTSTSSSSSSPTRRRAGTSTSSTSDSRSRSTSVGTWCSPQDRSARWASASCKPIIRRNLRITGQPTDWRPLHHVRGRRGRSDRRAAPGRRARRRRPVARRAVGSTPPHRPRPGRQRRRHRAEHRAGPTCSLVNGSRWRCERCERAKRANEESREQRVARRCRSASSPS